MPCPLALIPPSGIQTPQMTKTIAVRRCDNEFQDARDALDISFTSKTTQAEKTVQCTFRLGSRGMALTGVSSDTPQISTFICSLYGEAGRADTNAALNCDSHGQKWMTGSISFGPLQL
ncbi:hypothetical protein CIHG_06004 [Coccidioides immitis H538.4]|uniref:Uncharacterized protein n=3 Tax=Coccidioides immitis TaxID=5501 RepID=A0A0J8QV97_COCIT|nr:hypothetical protein CIRG_01753 [Coccidioides immitis RMSCC 2394]KMU76411.1 hypothetical protein CISG_01145 [Coccidioides immitis RMSCC 3703]KMU87612.1 hypothetical protein CIHG_06004 [Coccidioides immitis H538.4]